MNSQAAKAAVAGRVSLRARRAAGARISAYGSGSSSARSGTSGGPFPGPSLLHQLGHLRSRGALTPGDRVVSVSYPGNGGLVGKQLDRGFQRLQVSSRDQDDVLPPVAGDVDAIVCAVDILSD